MPESRRSRPGKISIVGRCALVALVAGFMLGSPAPAQIPSTTQWILLGADTTAPSTSALLGLDASGQMTTMHRLTTTTARSIAMAPGNRDLLIWDDRGLIRYDTATGASAFTSLAGSGRINWGELDEDGGMIWGTFAAEVFKSTDLVGTNSTMIQRVTREGAATGGWNGSTGDYYTYFLGSINRIGRFGGGGRVTTSPVLTGFDWSPFSGDTFVTHFGLGRGPGISRLDSSGRLATLGPTDALTAFTSNVEVEEQPIERLAVVEGGTGFSFGNFFTVVPPNTVTTIRQMGTQGFVRPVDVTVFRGRPLWGTARWQRGVASDLTLSFGPAHASAFYRVALSFGHRPGLSLGAAGRLHLAPDGLFFTTLLPVPGIFDRFSGRLDATGTAVPSPRVRVMNLPVLQGVRMFAGAIAFDPSGVRAISNAWGIVIE